MESLVKYVFRLKDKSFFLICKKEEVSFLQMAEAKLNETFTIMQSQYSCEVERESLLLLMFIIYLQKNENIMTGVDFEKAVSSEDLVQERRKLEEIFSRKLESELLGLF